eukprot:CAMPEP_0174830734 /NCGR_PEP_ID=MMETSP1114-20130205/2689_1 /TAXON_ID=312471 /ORGANISM="Neobodo designis, Strain CCAP 1951/1" /LENGTH=311 /DNA_ID=CAMNT_0016064537 /DNA_START=24 /DNA_END=959 /DNA_ORIENTATION=-
MKLHRAEHPNFIEGDSAKRQRALQSQIPIERVCVQGEFFSVQREILLRCAFFRGLFGSPSCAVDRDPSGAILVDRDPAAFADVVTMLQGFGTFAFPSHERLQMLLADIDFYGVDAELVSGPLRMCQASLLHTSPDPEVVPGPIDTNSMRLRPGACVFTDGRRLRNSYHVCPLSRESIVAGESFVSVRACDIEYVGIGVISEEVTSFDAEFHKVKNCAVFYMSGLMFTNFGPHRRDETRVTWTPGDVITAVLSMDERTLSFWKADSFVRAVHIGSARALRFAVVLKDNSEVHVVDTPADVLHALAAHRGNNG